MSDTDETQIEQPKTPQAQAKPAPKLKRIAASNSFTEGEVAVMEFIVMTLLRKGDATGITRNKDFASFARKVAGMNQTVTTLREQREAAEQSNGHGDEQHAEPAS